MWGVTMCAVLPMRGEYRYIQNYRCVCVQLYMQVHCNRRVGLFCALGFADKYGITVKYDMTGANGLYCAFAFSVCGFLCVRLYLQLKYNLRVRLFCMCGLSCAGSFAGKYITAGVWACFVRWALPISAKLPREHFTDAGGLANKSIKIKKGWCGRISGVL